jgi:hypothetical protein
LLVLFPLVVAFGLSLVVAHVDSKSGGIPASIVPTLLSSFLFFFVIGAATLPTAIADCCLVGEKVERNLEPLLATPVSDTDILLGKSLTAIVPSVLATWLGAAVFMVISDIHDVLGYLFFPNLSAWIVRLGHPADCCTQRRDQRPGVGASNRHSRAELEVACGTRRHGVPCHPAQSSFGTCRIAGRSSAVKGSTVLGWCGDAVQRVSD